MAQSMQELPNLRRGERQNDGTGLKIREDPQRQTVSRMKNSYAEEIKQQMEADKERKRKSKERDINEDLHFLDESFKYQPFGRGGGGAPLRDQYGNMITSFKPNFRGDHHRTHFLEFMKKANKGSRGSSRKSNHFKKSHGGHHNKHSHKAHTQVYDDESDSVDMLNEPDRIAQGPINNTTAATAAAMASNEFFRPDYIVDYGPKKKQRDMPMPYQQKEVEAPPKPPAITYQIVQPQVDWAAWRNELFALLQWERWQREEEEKRRKYQWMNDEEK